MGTLITISDAFRAALVAGGNTGTTAHKVVAIGLATAAFDSTNTNLTKLPNELKRIAAFGGENIAPDTIHVTLQDSTPDQYTLWGFGYYLEDGTLAAYYCNKAADGPIMEKSPVAMLLLSTDIRFTTIDAAALTFGDATFLNPPATTEVQGVVELATNAEAIAGTDKQRAVTPAGLQSAVAVAIANKSEVGHHHVIGDVDGLQAALDAKSPVGHVHAIANVTGLQSALDSKLGLAGGELTGSLRLKTTGTYSAGLYFDANGYAPYLRSSSLNRQLEFVDSASQNINAILSDGGVLSLPRARPAWAGLVPWDSGNLPNPMTTTGGILDNNAQLVVRPTYGKTSFNVQAPDGTGIGGTWASWNGDRTPALQIDSPNSSAAYMGLRWTRWGGRHLAAIDAYEGGSQTSEPSIAMHIDGQSNAWAFGRTSITRGAGGSVWGSWNFDPNTRVNKEGDTMRNVLNVTNASNDLNGYQATLSPGSIKLNEFNYGPYVDFARARSEDYRWRIHYNFSGNSLEFLCNGGQYVSFVADGNIYCGARGYVWDAINGKQAAGNYNRSADGHSYSNSWDGNIHFWVDGAYQGQHVTNVNGQNFANGWQATASANGIGANGLGSYALSNTASPTFGGVYSGGSLGLAAGTWRCMNNIQTQGGFWVGLYHRIA